jgi:hypothetical protein
MRIGLKTIEMVSCERAKVICNKNQYREAGALEKAQLMLHLLFCKACFKFSRKNNRLTHMIRKASLHALSKEEKERMKQQLQNPGHS